MAEKNKTEEAARQSTAKPNNPYVELLRHYGYSPFRGSMGWGHGYSSPGSARGQKQQEKILQEAQRERERCVNRMQQDIAKRAMSCADILGANEKAGGVQWIVPNFLAKGGLHLLSGAPGAAKTYTALDLCHHLVTGRPWFGQEVQKTGVLYVDEEMGAIALGDRLRQIGFTEDDRLFGHCRQGYKVHDPDDIRRLSNMVREHNLGVVIFDTMVAVHDYAESENSDMRKIREDVRPLLDRGLAVLFLHHNRKGSDASNAHSLDMARGAGDIVGMMDMAFSLVKTGNGTFRLSPTKPRLVPEGDALSLDFRLQTDAAREHVDLVRIDPIEEKQRLDDEARNEILEAIAANGGEMRSGDLADVVHKRHESIRRHADQLVREGLLWSEKRKERGSPLYYGIKEKDAVLPSGDEMATP